MKRSVDSFIGAVLGWRTQSLWDSVLLAAAIFFAASNGFAADSIIVPRPKVHDTNAGTVSVHPIDLPTALRLAGAQNLDIQIARQRLAEARANHESARWQFLPALTPGASYRRHDNLIQDVGGSIIDVHKEAYTVGPTLAAQVDLGDAIYKTLASRQIVKAADYALEAQEQDAVLAAAQG